MGFLVYPTTTITTLDMIQIPPTTQMNDCAKVEILNDASTAMGVVLPGNIQDWLSPRQAKFFESDDFYGSDIKLFPVQVTTGSNTGLNQQVTIIGFKKGEQTPPGGTTIDLGKEVVITNSIPVGTKVSTVQNDTSVAGTVYIESTVNGDSSSSSSLTVDGVLTLGNTTHNGAINVIGGDIDTSGNSNTAGNSTVGGNQTISGNTLTAGTTTTDGLTLSGNNLTFPDGSHVSEIHSFSGSGTGTFAHNCSAKPDTILLTCANPGGGSQTMGYDPNTLNATTVHVTAGAGLPWVGLAIVH